MVERHPRWFMLLALLLVGAAYAPSIWNGYAMDDRFIAMGVGEGAKHPMVYDLRPIEDYFREPYWKGHVERDFLFRPVTVYSYALVHDAFKPPIPDFADEVQAETARPQHVVNVLLHLLAMLVVYALVKRLRVSRTAAVAAAFLFGVHAVHSEAVAGIVGRAELFGFCFGGLATLALCGTSGWRWWLRLPFVPVGVAFLFLAFGSKESAVGWIGFLVVYGLAVRWSATREPIGFKRAFVGSAGYVAIAAIPAAAFVWLWLGMIEGLPAGPDVPAVYTVNPIAEAPTAIRMATATFLLVYKGLGLTFAPFDLSANYGASVLPILTGLLDPRFALALGILLFILIGGLVVGRRHPLLFLAATSFLGMSFITSNIPFAIGTIFAERLLYTPSVALSLFVAWIMDRTVRGPERVRRMAPLCWGMLGLWAGASLLVILQRNPVWTDDDTLFLHEAVNQPTSTRMLVNAASIHRDRGELDTAIRYAREALRLDPEYALAWNNLSAVYLEKGRLREAEAAARQGLLARHTDKLKEDLFKLHCNLGIILRNQGRDREAYEAFVESAVAKPKHERAWRELIALAKEKAGPEAAFAAVARAESRVADSPHWPYYRGILFRELGDPDKAAASFRQALTIDPSLHAARVSLLAVSHDRIPPDTFIEIVEAGERAAPYRAEWPYYRAVARVRQKRIEAAINGFVDALERDPAFAPASQDLLVIAQTYEQPKGAAFGPWLATAERIVGEREAKQPTAPHWPFLRGIMLGRLERAEDALQAMGRSLAAKPGFVAAWNEMNAIAAGFRLERRVAQIIDQLRVGRTEREWPYYRALAHGRVGSFQVAEDDLAEAIRRDPTYLAARIALLDLIHDAWVSGRVRTVIRDGLIQAPNDPHWPLYSGLLLYREARYREAVPSLQKALEALPRNVKARLALADALARLGDRKTAAALLAGLLQDPGVDPASREKARVGLAALEAQSVKQPGAKPPEKP